MLSEIYFDRYAKTSRGRGFHPSRWVQVCPQEQTGSADEESTQPEAQCGDTGGSWQKDDE